MVSELKDRELINNGVFAVAEMSIKETRQKSPYLAITLKDKSGSLEGVIWDCSEIPTDFKVGDPVEISGMYYAQFNNVHLSSIKKYEGKIDPEDFLPSSRRDINDMLAELEHYKKFTGPYETLVRNIFDDDLVAERFPKWPAGVEVHQAYIGGLLEHTLSVTRISRKAAEYYEDNGYEIDPYLTTAGALLHDIGKIEELDCSLTIRYTERGHALGHSYIGARFVERKIKELEEPNRITETQETQLLHIILSHMAKFGNGSVEPKTAEARLVCTADLLDSDMNRSMIVLEQQRKAGITIGSWDKYLKARMLSLELWPDGTQK